MLCCDGAGAFKMNRGTAKLVGGEVEEALTDYRTALSLVRWKRQRPRHDTAQH